MLQMKGFRVILAHVERYESILEDMDSLDMLYDMGVLIQVNAGSIIGKSGRRVKKFVHDLLENQMVFCVGTDAHGAKERAPRMEKAAQYVAKKYGRDYAKRIFFSNARLMLKKRS